MLNTTEFAISLIKEELHNLKLINDLNRAGIDASTHLLDFSTLILEFTGFGHKASDEFYEWYVNRQNELVENIDPENDKEFRERAFSFYADLMEKKRYSGLIESISN